MRKILIIIFLMILNLLVSAQSKLKPGFDAKEFIDVLHLEWAHQDSGSKYAPKIVPLNYKRVYRSPEVGLKNKVDFWIRNDSVGVICLRYTVGGTSWLENFYSGLIRAQGSLKLNDSTTFSYKFSNDDKALLDLYSLSMTLLYILYNNKEQIINEIYIKNFIVDILKPSIIFNNSKRITITQIIQKIKDLNKKYNIILSDL